MTKFNFGDLVNVEGYGERIFEIDGWRVEQYYYPNEEWTDFVYELTDVHSAEWLEADAEDLRLVASADKAEDYLETHEPVKSATYAISLSDIGSVRTRKVSPEIERYNKARERERRINELLDERNDYARLCKTFGDEKYSERIAEIDKELADVE